MRRVRGDSHRSCAGVGTGVEESVTRGPKGRRTFRDDVESRSWRRRHACRPRALRLRRIRRSRSAIHSWIHHEDFIAAVGWLIDGDDVNGTVNIASPNPLPNAVHACAASGMRHPVWPAGERMDAEVGAVLMRTETELILNSRPALPGCSSTASRSGTRTGTAPPATCAISGSARTTNRAPPESHRPVRDSHRASLPLERRSLVASRSSIASATCSSEM